VRMIVWNVLLPDRTEIISENHISQVTADNIVSGKLKIIKRSGRVGISNP
jgi:hypothetical protein